MCGLFGFKTINEATLSDIQKEQRSAVVRTLAVMMQERGAHSSGIASITRDNQIITHKKAIAARQFILSADTNDLLLRSDSLIGHTRFATHGAVNDQNAHPFSVGTITGAHNGMVYNHYDIAPDSEVDSVAIFKALNEANNDSQKAFSRLSGLFALTWVDSRDTNKLYLAADGNPLYWAYMPELGTLFWASTTDALHLAFSLATGHDIAKLWYPTEGLTFTFDEKCAYQSKPTPFMAYSMPKKTKISKKERRRIKKIVAEYQKERDEEVRYNRRTSLAYCDWCGGNISLEIDGYYERENGECVCIDCGLGQNQWGFTYVPPFDFDNEYRNEGTAHV